MLEVQEAQVGLHITLLSVMVLLEVVVVEVVVVAQEVRVIRDALELPLLGLVKPL